MSGLMKVLVNGVDIGVIVQDSVLNRNMYIEENDKSNAHYERNDKVTFEAYIDKKTNRIIMSDEFIAMVKRLGL